MKKIFVFLLTILSGVNVCFADIFNIRFNIGYNEDGDIITKPRERSSFFPLPSAIYDTETNTLIIKSLADIDNVHITVTDGNGITVTDEHLNLSLTPSELQLPDNIQIKNMKIIIEYENTYLYGIIH